MKRIIKTYSFNLGVFALFFCILFSSRLKAQQATQFSQYMYNNLGINPAYAGNRGALSVFGMHRSQWVGFEDAPVSYLFSAHTPIQNSRLGFGLSFSTESIGPLDDTNASADVSYWIPLNERFRLSFGLRFNANFFNLSNNRLNPQQSLDPLLSNVGSEFNPNVGVGMFLHSQKTFIGLSVPTILRRSSIDSDSFLAINTYRPTAYLYGGYVFEVFPFIKFKPATFLKFQEGAPLQVDITSNVLFYDKFTLGAAYRWDAAVSFLAGFQINQRLFIGYTYDVETTALQKYNSGSHEIFIRFEFFNRKDKLISPRFF
jgi:type IX secretion system PorP/SprF family membrane protein